MLFFNVITCLLIFHNVPFLASKGLKSLTVNKFVILNHCRIINICRFIFPQVSGMAPSIPGGPTYPYGHSQVLPTSAPTQQYGGYMAPGMGRSLGKQGVSSELLNDPAPAPVIVNVPVIPIVKEPSNGMCHLFNTTHGLFRICFLLAVKDASHL